MKKYILIAVGCLMQLTLLDARDAEKKSRLDFALEYTTELQTDLRGVNWANLLRMDFSASIFSSQNHALCIDAATISIANTCEGKIFDGIQGFSNINEDNTTLAMALMSLNWKTRHTSLDVGIRNMNEKYFTTPVTAFFTGSSCGIFPTISVNFPIANYPVASVGVDFEVDINNWKINASLYNGIGYKAFTGRNNIFRFCPGSDGIAFISSVEYRHNGSYYIFGNILHHGHPADVDGGKAKTNFGLWTYSEIKVAKSVSIMPQFSTSPLIRNGCRNYAGLGILYSSEKIQAGFHFSYADLVSGHEVAAELSCGIPLSDRLYLQPAVHFIGSLGEKGCVGLLRLVWGL